MSWRTISKGFPSNVKCSEGTPGIVGSPSTAFFHQLWTPHHGTGTPQQRGPGFCSNQEQFGPAKQMGPGFLTSKNILNILFVSFSL
jgi:hypothetical protein